MLAMTVQKPIQYQSNPDSVLQLPQSLHGFGQVPSLFEQEVRVRTHGSLPATGTGTVLNKCNGGSDTASVTQLKHSLLIHVQYRR